MGKFIIIGDCWLEVFFKSRRPVHAYPGGEAARVAEALCHDGHTALLLTEIGNDSVGTDIAAELREKGIDLTYSDMYAPKTALVVRDADGSTTRYDAPVTSGDEGFDITYPQVKADDVVVFGGYMAVDRRIRRRLLAFLAYCAEVKARLVYIPDIVDSRIPHPTPVMSSVLENLELADLVIALPGDIERLYGTSDPAVAYSNNVSFYCRAFAVLTPLSESADFQHPGSESAVEPISCSVATFGGAPGSAHEQQSRILADILSAFALS